LNADTNAWKSSLFQRLTTAVGDPGAITLYGDNTTDHRMFADQLLAEVPVRVNAKGRTIDEWKERPNMQDNHELDCMTGNMVMASMLGVNLGGGTGVAVAGGRKKVSVPQHMRRG
jgi:hypothetical protein